jgi:predicted glycoside hydrolase/deacetylase ChbG (UPF0249 family)
VRRIAVCADDFGMNPGIDDGIVELARLRRLSAVSCLTSTQGFVRNASRLADLPVDLGVHLNFTEALDEPGLHVPLPLLIAQTYAHMLDKRRIERQIERQVEAFESTLGRAPDFIDGHQHVHQLPQIREALFRVLQRRYSGRTPWVRSSAPPPLRRLPPGTRVKAGIIGTLGGGATRRAARAAGVRTNTALIGVYDLAGGMQVYDALLTHWLAGARDGELLMCHPARCAPATDALSLQRMAEYQVLARPALSERLLSDGLRIVRLSQLLDSEAQASITLRVNASR